MHIIQFTGLQYLWSKNYKYKVPVSDALSLQVLHTVRYLSGKVMQLFRVYGTTGREMIKETCLTKGTWCETYP